MKLTFVYYCVFIQKRQTHAYAAIAFSIKKRWKISLFMTKKLLKNEFSSSHIISNLCELIVGFGIVHKISSDDRDYSAEDFPETAENAVKCFSYLHILLKELELMEHSYKRHFIINVLLLCATHSRNHHWSNCSSISSSKDFVNDLLQHTVFDNLSKLLCAEDFLPTIFKGMLKKLRPSLLKDTWMHYPSSCYVFHWLLCHVKHPYLVEYLPDVFPPPFMFVSYHAVPQKVIGIQCFNHLLDNIPPTLIELDGKEDAIYHTLFPLTYSKDIPIVEILYPCLLKLPMINMKKKKLVYWDEKDKILDRLLFVVDCEDNLELKRLFFSHIKDFVDCSQPFNHLKRMMPILKRNLIENPFSDIKCQITALKIIRSVIMSCWPRMKNYCFDILVAILDLQQQNSTKNIDEINELSEECLILLKNSCSEHFESLTSKYIESSDVPGVDLLKKVLKQ
ncbi:TELO2-interacting protein 2 [Caerostris darwini]|uniref:TELO2-interacting protein 2 n=1 Tax=Caerostris darwini TaxID=1538125 RepID=A0AAV4SX56_9ARAC|nr:TELO2-interacting protein 2 [Caerostris darwini]